MIDKTSFDAITGGCPEAAREIADLFRSDSQRLLDELRVAIADGEDSVVRRLGHTLKSTCATVGAEEASAIARATEEQGLTGALQHLEALDQLLPAVFAALDQVVSDLATA